MMRKRDVSAVDRTSAGRTLPTVTSIRKLGGSPRLPGPDVGVPSAGGRDERGSLPSHRQVMSLLSMAVVPEDRRAFQQRFDDAREGKAGRHNLFCQTPISVIAKAFQSQPFQLRDAADMFPQSGLESYFLNEFYIMDAILNRAPSLSPSLGANGDAGNAVRHVLLCDLGRPGGKGLFVQGSDPVPSSMWGFLLQSGPSCWRCWCGGHIERL